MMKTSDTTFSQSSVSLNENTTGGASICSRVFNTEAGYAPIILRVGLATVLFPHGAQKLLGWFGGYGFEGTVGFLTSSMGLPWIVAVAVILIEFFGPLFLLAGVGTRIVALAMGSVMTGAMFMAQVQHGFFMNWFGNQAGEGIEYSLLFISGALALIISGGGAFSVDRILARLLRKNDAA